MKYCNLQEYCADRYFLVTLCHKEITRFSLSCIVECLNPCIILLLISASLILNTVQIIWDRK